MVIPLRDENPTKTFPFVTVCLIAINIFVFVFELSLGLGTQSWEKFIYSHSMFPYRIVQGDLTAFLSIFTSMFLHGSWLHIIGNMLYLWIFGNNVEDYMGHFKFFFFYFLCGLGGAVGQILSNPTSTVPNLGASGAIAGILGAYLILYPGARILTAVPLFFFIQIIKLPAIFVIGFWFIIQVLSGLSSLGIESGGVAWFAHIGGFASGVILILFLHRRKHKNNYFNYFTFSLL